MTNFTEELDDVLREAETSVLRVLAKAAESADYAAIDRARHLAKQIRQLGADAIAGQTKQQETKVGPPRKRKQKTRNNAPSGYPKFRVAGGSLFKTGWSKKNQREYEHRVPLEVVEKVVDAVDELANQATGAVTGEKIIESKEIQALGELPSYQVYIVLALLRDSGVVEATGREGYRLPVGLGERARKVLHAITAKH